MTIHKPGSSIPTPMPRQILGLLVFLGLPVLMPLQNANPCSTFLLEKDGILIVGHNLDSESPVPGVVVVNNRGFRKQAKSWSELAYGDTVPNPPMEWTSKYGSITFGICRDFPDGGMNEAGVFIAEMSLANTQFPEDTSKPLLFMMLWMQYVLDTCDSVDQVVRSAHDLTIDGWNWHFFTADRQGRAAAIEFIEGKVVVHTGDSMPVPILINSVYAEEMKTLKKYEGFGGSRPIRLSDDSQPLFIHGARMIQEAGHSKKTAVDYGFDVLAKLGSDWTQWSYLCDLKNLKVHFKTKESPEIKKLDFKAFDLSNRTPAKMLDIHADLSGSAEKHFQDHSLKYNRECVRRVFLAADFEPVFVSHGSTLEEAVTRFSEYAESTQRVDE